MRVAIIGAGVSGQAAIKYWLAKGAQVTVRDRLPDIVVPAGVETILGRDYLRGLNQYDLIVRSPGVRPQDLRVTVPVTTGVREFFERCPARIIGITGVRGKIATASLIARMLEEAGRRVWLGGDVGLSPLDFLGRVKASDLVILELSSFQLMDLDVSPHIAVCQRVSQEDMDWHGSMREYIAAKGNLFWHQQPGDVAIYDAGDDFSTQIAQLSPGEKVPYLASPGARVEDGQVVIAHSEICPIDALGPKGTYNLENVCAAVTVAWGVTQGRAEPIRRAVQKFKSIDV